MRNVPAVAFLVVGFASGVASTTIFVRSHERSVTDLPSRSHVLDAMADEVGLDGTQRTQAHEISDRSHVPLTKIRKSAEPEIKAIRADVRAQLRSLMTQEQQQRFDAYCARRDAQRVHEDD